MERLSRSSLFFGFVLLASVLQGTTQNEIMPRAENKKVSNIKKLRFMLESLSDGTFQASLHQKIICEIVELTPLYLQALVDFMNVACGKAIEQYPAATAALYTMQLNDFGCIYVYTVETESGEIAPPLVFWNSFEDAIDALPEELVQVIEMIQKEYLQ